MPGAVDFDPNEVRSWFPELTDVTYLNSAQQGVAPGEAVTALTEAAKAWGSGTADPGVWSAAAEQCRTHVASLLGMRSVDVALLPSHVLPATMIAQQLPEATVVLPEIEFRSNLLPWTTSRDPELVRLVSAPADTDRMCAAIDHEVDLVAVSSVQSATGLRVDLPRLVRHAHEHGALVYIDASQSLGVDAELATCGADFIAAAGYKWLLGARGTGYLGLRPELARRFYPVPASPQSSTGIEDGRLYGTDYEPWSDARRFDQPPAWLAWVASVPGARLLASLETMRVDRYVTGLANRFVDRLRENGIDVATRDRDSAVVRVEITDSEAAARRLSECRIRASSRANGLRFAFHLFNDESDVDSAVECLINDGSRRQRGLRARRTAASSPRG